jgi:pyruvate dehydrogenase E1 component alpha subunit
LKQRQPEQEYSPQFLASLYRKMLLIRESEESFVAPILEGEIRCPVHLYTGQEATAVGVCAALQEGDRAFGSHRSHGHYLALGGDLRAMVAEIYGKEEGCARGRGGSMHLVWPEAGFLGAAPIVGGTIPLALGAALASSIRTDKQVVVSFFGDGATGEGVLFESLNFAALRRLPLIFVCENNLYSTHLPLSECRPHDNISEVATPFGVPSQVVDGNDVLGVFEAAKTAVEAARDGAGPAFLEARTYRMRGHVGPDDNIQGTHTDIRPTQEIELWSTRDPIVRFEEYLQKGKVMAPSDFRGLREETHRLVQEAHEHARACPLPPTDGLSEYLFHE